MNTETMPLKKTHHGRNVRRLREMLGIKQEALAFDLDMTQQNFSRVEQKEEIEDQLLEKIANALKVPAEAIRNMNDEATINYINTFNTSDTAISNVSSSNNGYNYNFNPIEKLVELYERMLKTEQEKVATLEQILKDKK
jgi:transcriptional regulator with XRE-family HTH domain